jgi:hypothetical protein
VFVFDFTGRLEIEEAENCRAERGQMVSQILMAADACLGCALVDVFDMTFDALDLVWVLVSGKALSA